MATKTNTKINGQEYFRITRTVGHKLVDGIEKPIKKQFYGTSKGDAEQRYKEYVNEQARAKYLQDEKLDNSTLHDRAKEYIESELRPSARLASGTKRRYESSYECHISGTWIDQMPVKDISASDLKSFYTGLDVSMSTMKQLNRFMSGLYRWMVRYEYASDIVAAVDLPIKPENKHKEEIVIWDDASWEKLTSSIFDFRHDFLIKLMCYQE